MGGKRERVRTRARAAGLPPEVKERLHMWLADINWSYRDISHALSLMGYQIGKSAIGEYAQNYNQDIKRARAARERIDAIIAAAVEHKNLQATEAATAMYLDRMIEYLSTLDAEDFEGVPADRLGRVLERMSRTEAVKQKERDRSDDKKEVARRELIAEISEELHGDPELLARVVERIERYAAREEAAEDD